MIDDPVNSTGGSLGQYAYSAPGNRSMSEVIKDIIANVQGMVRSEIRLAKAELTEEAAKTASAAKWMGIGAGLGLFAAAFILTSISLLLSLVMPDWAAAMAVGVVLAIGAAVMFSKGRAQLTLPKAQKTLDNVKENVEWMKNQTR